MFVDVHSHLTHRDFLTDLPEVVARAEAAGLTKIVVNGLEPRSNRTILELAGTYPIIEAAVGIYPIEAVHDLMQNYPSQLEAFDVEAEIRWIREAVAKGKAIAVGECGLDGYWAGPETFAAQEKVFEQLIEIAVQFQRPIIVHSRKREARTMEILAAYKVEKVDFHCFCGKSKLAISHAEKYGWYFSIPANARKSESFQVLLKNLPPENILTETDCPYLGPVRGERNEPANVVGTVHFLAELRGWSIDHAKSVIWKNYQRLFQ